eukprot:COSAG02_NODE_10053_length_2038_cov_1.352759_1_plen_508_part_00
MTTYQLSAVLNEAMTNVYALYGNADTPLSAPPAFQVPAPMGAHTGGVSPVLFSTTPDAQYDSWLTIGSTDGSATISTAGISFDTWTASTALAASDGLIFVQPDTGLGGTVVVGQLTVSSDTSPAVTMGMQGRYRALSSFSNDPYVDWSMGVTFQLGSPPAVVADAEYSLLTSATMSEIDSAADGFTTYEIIVELGEAASNVYAIYGNAESPMSFPSAFGVGTSTWLTIGRDTAQSTVSSAGIDWDAWTVDAGFSSTDALVFVTPDLGVSASAPVMLGQITVATGTAGAVTLGLQGQSTGDAADWQLGGVAFAYGGGAVKVSSAITFASAQIDDLSEGSPERTSFETDFKAAMGSTLGVETSAITVDSIQAGSVVVEFSVIAAPEAAAAVSGSLDEVAETGATITVGNYQADTSTLAAPTVVAAPPSVTIPQPPPPPPPPPPAPAPATEEEGSSTGTIVIVVLILVLCGGVAALFISKRGSDDADDGKKSASGNSMDNPMADDSDGDD